jgi:anaerobic selenocysteine-containing dehydrogenase
MIAEGMGMTQVHAPHDQTPDSTKAERIRTYCLMCSVRCPVDCRVENGRLVDVIPDTEHPLGGTICVKRTKPKPAADPGWERISWDEALDTVAKKLLDAKASHGAESVVF